ncbi:MAG TPA: phosphomannomutase, partial [Deltaproteobacteria bacterium]|nr:phosphomannomutase [Deltaproteobacteria bacterium]
MDPKVFREYDIRGIVGEQITEEDVRILGQTFGTYMKQQGKTRVVVGRDCRHSSKPFRDKLVEGMLSTGLDIVDLGICPTPVFYFSLRHLEREGGMMITASHNPPEYNGFKICNGYDTISGQEIQRLRVLMEKGDFVRGEGKVEEYDIITSYMEFIKNNIK